MSLILLLSACAVPCSQKYSTCCHSPAQATLPGLGLPLSCMGNGDTVPPGGFLSPEHQSGRAETFCITVC